MLRLTLFFALVVLVSFQACYYDNEEELYPNITCNTDNIKYSSDINAILTTRCLSCHNAASASSIGAGINLEGYNNLKVWIDNNRFMGAIRHSAGFSPMPKGGSKLPDCELKKIESWANAGFPNN